jgi:hypothetical protein
VITGGQEDQENATQEIKEVRRILFFRKPKPPDLLDLL